MIACLLVCAAMVADAQNAASHAAPAPAAPMVATPVSALQKRRDDLQTAIVKDDLPRIAAFIRSGMQLDFNFDDEAPRQRSSESPLTMAVNRNKLEVARLLLDAGADAKRMTSIASICWRVTETLSCATPKTAAPLRCRLRLGRRAICRLALES